MCSAPVTFGGGTAIVYGGFPECGSDSKPPAPEQAAPSQDEADPVAERRAALLAGGKLPEGKAKPSK